MGEDTVVNDTYVATVKVLGDGGKWQVAATMKGGRAVWE